MCALLGFAFECSFCFMDNGPGGIAPSQSSRDCIRQFMQWCTQGASTYRQRYELFVRQRAAVEAEMERMQRTLDMLRYKCWYYETAIQEGGEEHLKGLSPEEMPEEIRRAYESAHGT